MAANARGNKARNSHDVHGYIAQWLERLTADQQVPGSNPGVPYYFYFALASITFSASTKARKAASASVTTVRQ